MQVPSCPFPQLEIIASLDGTDITLSQETSEQKVSLAGPMDDPETKVGLTSYSEFLYQAL